MSTPAYQLGEEFARRMDAEDSLGPERQRFHIPKTNSGAECVYLCGHSLGLQPKNAAQYVEQELRDWAKLGVEGHFSAKNPWFTYHRLLTQQTAELVGAETSEVVVIPAIKGKLYTVVVDQYRALPDTISGSITFPAKDSVKKTTGDPTGVIPIDCGLS